MTTGLKTIMHNGLVIRSNENANPSGGHGAAACVETHEKEAAFFTVLVKRNKVSAEDVNR